MRKAGKDTAHRTLCMIGRIIHDMRRTQLKLAAWQGFDGPADACVVESCVSWQMSAVAATCREFESCCCSSAPGPAREHVGVRCPGVGARGLWYRRRRRQLLRVPLEGASFVCFCKVSRLFCLTMQPEALRAFKELLVISASHAVRSNLTLLRLWLRLLRECPTYAFRDASA